MKQFQMLAYYLNDTFKIQMHRKLENIHIGNSPTKVQTWKFIMKDEERVPPRAEPRPRDVKGGRCRQSLVRLVLAPDAMHA